MYKNLLFDLGGVIVDIERNNCVRAFEQLGLANADSYFGLYAQSGIFMALEDGSASVEQFHDALRSQLPAGTSDALIDEAFQRFITGIPAHRLATLRRLRAKGYGLYLLSNTNRIMWDGILADEFTKEGLSREQYFDGMVTSFEARAVKPDKAIFDYTVSHLGIKPGDTLFFDDSQSNVTAARAYGFNAVLVEPGKEFIDYLPE